VAQVGRIARGRVPHDAIIVCQKLIGPIVERTHNDAYAEAAGLLQRIEKLMAKLGKRAEFRQYLTQVCAEHRAQAKFHEIAGEF